MQALYQLSYGPVYGDEILPRWMSLIHKSIAAKAGTLEMWGTGTAAVISPVGELGYKGVELANWFAVYAPAGTPPAVLKKLNAAFVKVGRSAEMREKFDWVICDSPAGIERGALLAMLDKTAAVCAMRHARKPCVTASIDRMDFRKPVMIGELQKNGQFQIVWRTPGLVVGDAWSDFIPESKPLVADWTYPWVCGNCAKPKYE